MSYSNALQNFLAIDVASMRPVDFIAKMNQAKSDWIVRVKGKSGYRPQSTCLVCGSTDREFNIQLDGMAIYQCKSCSLAYVDPFPVYAGDVYEQTYFNKSLVSYDSMRDYRIKRFGMERIRLIKKYVQKGKLLDIGCGVGWFLEAAKTEGFEIYGQEISKELGEYTQEKLGITVFSENLAEIKETFDVITMFDLLEHVMDPVKLIEQSKRLLNEGGIIVVFTPNYDSLGIQLLKEHSSLVCPPAHLTYFTKQSVEKLAELTGMSLVHLETKGMDIADIHAYYNHIGKKEAADELFNLFDQLQPIIDQSGAANHMRFILKK
ncbi:methyltransferase family protein [Sediminibacterium magnilacihabitans]|nr:methyltransferase family protein [Sediminibacterium magnilacihabitans]